MTWSSYGAYVMISIGLVDTPLPALTVAVVGTCLPVGLTLAVSH